MNPDKSLQVIARQLIVANRLKHIELTDDAVSTVPPSKYKTYMDDRKQYLDDLLSDINKDEQIMEE